jgi:hypothetical protein
MKSLMIALLLAGAAWSAETRVYELRTYTTKEGKLPDLLKRFRDHTTKLFEKHGIVNIGYWVPQDEPRRSNTLIYVVSHINRDEAKRNWDAFRIDPEWIKAKEESEKTGPIVDKVESVYMDATDFSKLK